MARRREVLLLAAMSGVADVNAITLSLSRMSQDEPAVRVAVPLGIAASLGLGAVWWTMWSDWAPLSLVGQTPATE